MVLAVGRKPGPVGPATEYLAGELRAQRARLSLSFDDLVQRTGLPRATIFAALSGQRAIAAEVLVMLCTAMNLDAGALMSSAAQRRAVTSDAPDAP